MDIIRQDVSLKDFNTFRVDCKARKVYFLEDEARLPDLASALNSGENFLPVGGGSNILFTGDYSGCVCVVRNKGIERIKETNSHVFLEVKAGEIWHDLVLNCNRWHLSGIENLALIPGTVGAAPVQNIGAYGVELKDVFEACRFFDFEKKDYLSLTKEECGFSYRDSIFKKDLQGKGLITSVTLKLSKHFTPNLTYGNISELLKEKGIQSPSQEEVSRTIIEIREAKLPNPKEHPNNGSFFKNPIVSEQRLNEVKERFGEVPNYFVSENNYKIPAAWLIEKSGCKGLETKEVKTWNKQPLVIVSTGLASGKEIFEFSEMIIEKVKGATGISLEREVRVL